MKKTLCVTVLSCLFCTFPAFLAGAKVYVAEPALVYQPTYAGMSFYVYKPYNMPENWYATFDGYPVTKNKDDVWVYGTYAGPNLIPTNYIVGSVVPSMAGLSPYANPMQISSISTIPQLMTQPNSMAAAPPPTHSTYMPGWLFNGRFMALGRWKDSVDRMGVLHKLNVPVAWLGNYPKVIYAWNGYTWHQMLAREYERPARVLKRNLHALTKQVRQYEFVWYEADMPVLSQQAAEWGYYWMGEVMPR